MEILSWDHWKNELKGFVDEFTRSKGLKMSSVLDVCQKRPTSAKWNMSLMFVPSARSPEISGEVLHELQELLPCVSRDWRYQISSVERDDRRLVLALSRIGVCVGAIQTIVLMSTEERRKAPVTVYLDSDRPLSADATLSSERQLLACDVISRLLRWAGHDVTTRHGGGEGDSLPPSSAAVICVTGNPRPLLANPPAAEGDRAAEEEDREGERGDGDRREAAAERCRDVKRSAARVVVEPVVNMRTGKKELDVTAAEFRRRRCAALLSAGQSRERGCSPDRAARLAAASSAHQLLAVSLNSPCRVRLESAPAADGAVFALYNAARLRSLLDRFEAGVADGTYPPLPTVAEIGHEFSRLSTEDEWELVWRHVLPFPSLLTSCAEGALAGRPALHKLCAGLTALSHTFSRYYSRTHVLTPPLEHLVATLHVRIHLLKAVQTVFATYFQLLGYEPLQRM